MQLIITDPWLAKSRPIHLSGWQLLWVGLLLSLSMMVVAALMYHWVFLKGAREGWPVIGSLVKFMIRDEFEQRDRFMHENIDAMAQRLGEMQAKVMQMEALGERVSGLAGINLPSKAMGTTTSPTNTNNNTSNLPKKAPGSGGVFVPSEVRTLEQLKQSMDNLEHQADGGMDWMTVAESRLFDEKIRRMMLPTQHPINGGSPGSGYGWRIDPFNGQAALHTGLDFQADVGTPIVAAAGGVVVTQELHPAYGNMVEIDHGNGLITRYAHTSAVHVRKGDLVKRGQLIAEVGTTGRSTGPHLHFEVLINNVTQDPMKFLNAGRYLSTQASPAPKASGQAVLAPANNPRR